MNPESFPKEWLEWADAAATVEALALDEDYASRVSERAVQETAHFSQGDDLLYISDGRHFSHSALTRFVAGSDLAVGAMDLTVESRGSFHFCRGRVTINQKVVVINSHEGTIYVEEEAGMPLMPIEPEDLTNFLLIATNGAIVNQDIETEQPAPWDRLRSYVAKMGTLSGESSNATRAVFPGNSEGIIVELTEAETPVGSSISNQLLLHRTADPFSDETALENAEHLLGHGDRVARNIAYRALSGTNLVEFLATAADNPLTPERGGISGSYMPPDSSPEDIQRYGRLCQDFLASYQRLTAERL